MPIPVEIVWDLAVAAPELVAHVPGGEAILAGLRGPLDPPASMLPSTEGRHIRPAGHHRAFYRAIEGGVVALKGSEPTCADFPSWVARMKELHVHVETALGMSHFDLLSARAEMRAIEKWPIVEGKIPGAYTLREGLGEARAALAFQRAHLARYGTPARVPLPLAVFRWPDEIGARTLATLAPLLSERARAIVESAVAGGLGAYAYFYPSVPHRLVHLTVRDVQHGSGYRARAEAMAGKIDRRATVEAWIALTARMLASGFVPKDPSAVMTGDCLQLQNVVLDGGFADVESLVATAQLDDRGLADALRRTIAELASSITRFLVGNVVPTALFRERIPDVYVHVWNEVARRLGADAPDDPRIAKLLDPGPAWDGLDRIFSLTFP